MKVVLQRVKSAFVEVDNKTISEINRGFLIFWGIEENDTTEDYSALIKKILNLRIFSDNDGKMNKSIQDVEGEILVVSQFTLAANYTKGNRPSFIKAKDPNEANKMINEIINEFSKNVTTKQGSFGASMQVGLVNDGPVTFILSSINGKLEEIN
jgi:D-tyrosyl-tRNA(Tyr) deacylase